MADTPIDPAAEYDVKVRFPCRFMGLALRPMKTQEMKGDVLALLIDQEGPDVVDAAIPR